MDSILWNKHDVQWQFFSVSNTWVTCDSLSHDLFVTQTRCACSVHSLVKWRVWRAWKAEQWLNSRWSYQPIGLFFIVFFVRKKPVFVVGEPVSFGNFVGKVMELEDLPWMVGLNVGVEVQGVWFFHWHNMSFFVSSSENGLFHPKRSCQHEKYGCWTNNRGVNTPKWMVKITENPIFWMIGG